jgi:outer membrane protein OmpA-like peptidoglycan-associated protein
VSKPVAPPPPPKLAPPPSPAAALPPPSPPAEPPQAEPATPPASDFVVRPVPPPPPLPHARRAPEAPSIAATAALAPSRSTQGETARIAFAGDDIEFSPEARRDLDALAVRLTDNERLHVDLLGYAAATSEPSQSRRLSLSRALAVRSYLVGRGIKSNRVDVRALGNRVEGTPADRVDVVVAER